MKNNDSGDENIKKNTFENDIEVDFIDLCKPILERDISFESISLHQSDFYDNGFPQVYRFQSSSTSFKKQSLYSRSRSLKDSNQSDNKSKLNCDIQNVNSYQGLLGTNTDQEMKKIDAENKQIIKNMSTKEIEDSLKFLHKKLTPGSIEFLKNRSKKRHVDYNEEQTKKIDFEKIQDKIPIKIEELTSGKYPKITIEADKLEWLGNIPEEKASSQDINDFQARFDFDGIIINSQMSEQIDVKQGLHHHNEEPSRAGYTIDELLIYVHSSFGAQKQLALKTFAAIIKNAYRGLYDNVFNHNLIDYLLKDTFLVLTARLCLDDSSESIWKHALQCFQAFICNTFEDEIFVDRGFLLFEDFLNFGFDIKLFLKPFLDNDVHIDDSVSDQQFITYDLIDCLIQRTNILDRFAYLLNTLIVHDTNDDAYVEIILDILIRFSRHSRKISESIIECQDLIRTVLDKYLLKHDCSIGSLKNSNVKTFKLIRILVTTIVSDSYDDSSDKDFFTLQAFLSQIFKAKFVKSLEFCLYINPDDNKSNASTLLRISIEGIRCWIKIISVCKRIPKCSLMSELQSIFSVASFVRIFDYCSSLKPEEADENINRGFDFQFASCIFVLAKLHFDILKMSNDGSEIGRIFFPKLIDICQRWLAILDNENRIPDFDSGLCILVLEEFILNNVSPNTLQIGYLTSKLLQNGRFIKKMFHFLKTSSNSADFRSNIPGNLRDSDNLPSFGSIYFRKFKSISLFNQNSCICIFLALMRIEERYQIFDIKSLEVVRILVSYVSGVARNIHSNYEPSVFDLIEIHIVSRACLSARNFYVQNIDKLLADDAKALIKFATLVNVLNATEIKAKLIVDILFDYKIWNSLSQHKFTEKNFEHFKQVYRKLSPFCDEFWLFHPLLNMIDFKVERDPKREPLPVSDVISCLKYIQLFLECFPEYFEKMKIKTSSFFILMCSVFFFPDLIFFDENVDLIMKDILQFLLKHKGGIIVKSEDSVPHIGNSIDFFERLLTEFEFSSMGSPIFCNYVLVFIQRECSNGFKRALLSNHSTDVERSHLMSITLDQLLLPMENFLLPIETEPEIIDIYFRCLGCPSVTPQNSPVLYCIMVHHVHHAIFRQSGKFEQKLDDVQKRRFQWLLSSLKRAPSLLQKHLKDYDHFDIGSSYGIVLK